MTPPQYFNLFLFLKPYIKHVDIDFTEFLNLNSRFSLRNAVKNLFKLCEMGNNKFMYGFKFLLKNRKNQQINDGKSNPTIRSTYCGNQPP